MKFLNAIRRIAALVMFAAGVLAASAETPPTLSPVALPVIPTNVVNLTDCGGIGDGQTFNTAAFEKALAGLSDKGGGELDVPPGLWLTGPIRLRSNINLHLERGALIQFSGDYKLYPLQVINLKTEKEVDSVSPIFGENLENVAITGEGIIDGGGDAWRPLGKAKLSDGDWKDLVKSGGVLDKKGETWWPSQEALDGKSIVEQLRTNNWVKLEPIKLEDYQPYHQFLRPKMLRLIGCKKVLLEDFTIQNPPNWTMNPVLCEDVSILNVQVRNLPSAQNSDALDLESCRRAVIRDCTFDVGDDGICIKSGQDAAGRRIGVPTEDVLVEGCTVYHAHGGFTIGSEMSGGVRNMLVTNCTFIGTDVGLRFKSTRERGGVVEKIFVSGIRMEGITGDAINFNLYYGGKSPFDKKKKGAKAGSTETNAPVMEKAPQFRDSHSVFSKKATSTETNVPVTEKTPQFRDLHLENIICRGAQRAIVLEGLPEMPVQNITLKNVSITSQQGVFVADADDIHFENVQVENKTAPQLTKVRVKNSSLELTK